jgi:hypothetical protein
MKCHYEGCQKGNFCYGYHPETDEYEWGACPCCGGYSWENCPKCSAPNVEPTEEESAKKSDSLVVCSSRKPLGDFHAR